MKIYSQDEQINVSQSIIKYLSETYYYRHEANSGTLSTYYPGLTFCIGWSSNLETLDLPLISLSVVVSPPTEPYTYAAWNEKLFALRADLFAGGQVTDDIIDAKKNAFMRDRMMSDVKNLLEVNEGNSYIDLYNFSDIIDSGTSYRLNGDIYVSDVNAVPLEPLGDIEADRFRAAIDFNASVIYSQS